MKIIGVDLGFGFTKATDGTKSSIFKSVIGEATSQQFSGSLLKSEATKAVTDSAEEHIHLQLDAGEFFFGELAERQSNVRSFTLDQGRFIEEAALPFSLAAINRVESGTEPVGVVAGLPISDFASRAAELEQRLRGQHSVTAVAADGTRTRADIAIDEVKVIPEPFGAIYNLVLQEGGQIANREVAEEKIGVIDVGFHTVDFTVSDRTSFLERASRSSEAGIARAFSVISAKLREKSDVNLPVYRLYDAVEKGRIRIRGNSYDLGKLTEHVFGQLATEIASQANELWSEEWDIDRIIISGGGGEVLSPYLTPLLQGRIETADADGDARLGNARGFVKYGHHLWGDQAGTSASRAAARKEDASTDEVPVGNAATAQVAATAEEGSGDSGTDTPSPY